MVFKSSINSGGGGGGGVTSVNNQTGAVTIQSSGATITITNPSAGVVNLEASGGASVSFTALTSGTNTAAAMHVGSGATLNATGTGTITATSVPASGLTGTTIASSVTGSSLTGVGALASGSLTTGFTPVTVPLGGTGDSTFTAYSIIAAGTTSTGAFQNVSGVGTSGQVLTSNGAAALPTWQAASGGVTSVTNSDGTLTISPTTGAVVASLALGHANTWTATQTLSAANLATDTTTGMKIGTATNQKVGFFNATPVVQQTGDISGALSTLGLVTSGTLPAADLTGTTLPSSIVTSSLTTVGTLGSLTVTGNIANSALSASQAVFTDASKNLISVATTGTGNVVRATSPTLITPALGTPTALVLTNATGLPVAGGGTGDASFTAYAVITGGTTSTGALQNVSGVGTSGQVLTSNGAGALPTWQAGGGGGSGSALTDSITQTAHGFSVQQAVYYTGSAYALAKADSTNTSDVIGIVSSVTNANVFVITTAGRITGLSGLTAGTAYFLDDSTAGALTATAPTASNHVSKPLLIADSATSGYFNNYRGEILAVSAAVTSLTVASANGFAGSFTSAPTPVLTLSTTASGVLIGDGTTISGANRISYEDTTNIFNISTITAGDKALTITDVTNNSLYFIDMENGSADSLFRFDNKARPVTGHTTPTIAAGTGAGTSPTVSVTGTDVNGVVSVTAGITAATSAIVATISFSTAYAAAPKTVIMVPANSAAALLSGATMTYVDPTNTTTAHWVITSGTTGLTATVQYKWQFLVIG
jgi:hypothetical protein